MSNINTDNSFADSLEIWRDPAKYQDPDKPWAWDFDDPIDWDGDEPGPNPNKPTEDDDEKKKAAEALLILLRNQTYYSIRTLVKSMSEVTILSKEAKPIYKNDVCDSSLDSKATMLYIGELRRNLPHNVLYGGYSDSAIENLTWLPASNYTPINKVVFQTTGDTYFQRYDCLKTYPDDDSTNINQVTELASVMIETHHNLDARTDVNRKNFNIMARPDNFGLYNDAYNQKNNIFTGSVLPELVNQSAFKSTYVWSLNKNYAGRVDTWTNLSTNSSERTRNEITKIINAGRETLYALETNCIETINFKERNLINTTSGMQINVDFNDKVNTLLANPNYGTHCSNVLITDVGVYFVDDNKNTIVCIGHDGNCKELPYTTMESYFKNAITISSESNKLDSSRFYYDNIHKDVYIIINNPYENASECIVYNEILQAFTSFIDAPYISMMFSYGGESYAFSALDTSSNNLAQVQCYRMFDGEYNKIFDNNYVPYSIEYRVNPGTYTDKVFTNVEFLADLGVSKDNSTKSDVQPFDKIRVWDEYQDTGVQPLIYDRDRVLGKVTNNLQQKFRIWRTTVPRNQNSRDRIRNPWVHLYLEGNPKANTKLELHNIVMNYYE